MNKAAAQIAKKCAAEATAKDKANLKFVAGVLGAGGAMLSKPSDPSDPAGRGTTWKDLVAAYALQVKGLVDGGVDLLLISSNDTLNIKAAIYAIEEYFDGADKEKLPLIVSVSVDGTTTESGQSLDAFCLSVAHAKPLAVGVEGK